jgi:hypothetical protein
MKNKQSIKKSAMFRAGLAGIVVLLAMGGCSINDEPRPRLGSYATSTPGTNFLDLSTLGEHKYYDGLFEKNGIVYTCEGGHIDIAHLRIGADYTRYLYRRTKQEILQGDRHFSFKLNVEPSRYYVCLTYPKHWKTLPEEDRERIADEVAMELGRYFTFTMVTWHEVLTFFGYKSMAFVPEFPSAFSWEDTYSNLLGIHLATAALQDKERGYDAAMTALLKAEMESLGIQPAVTARAAAEKMRGVWFEGNIFVTMKVRNMDIGLGDGTVTPMLVPGVCEGALPRSYPVPTIGSLAKYGFTMTLQVEPQEFEKGQILKVVCPDGDCKRILMPMDLPLFMDFLEKQATQMGCEVVK